MTSPPSPILVASNLERRFGHIVALRGANVTIAAGEMVLIVGPNGAGKSTLLRSIAGLARPSRGSVRVLGRDVHADPAARGAIGFVSHQTLLYHDLTARENLRFAAALHGLHLSDEQVSDALDGAGLADRANQRAGGFSRGVLQRLALLRATLHEPSLVLLDEPFTGLDSASSNVLRRRIASDLASHRALACVTHDPAQVWDEATRVLVLVGGQVVCDAPRPATLDAFRTTYDQLTAA